MDFEGLKAKLLEKYGDVNLLSMFVFMPMKAQYEPDPILNALEAGRVRALHLVRNEASE